MADEDQKRSHAEQTFHTESGSKASVSRETQKDAGLSAEQQNANHLLRILGRDYVHPVPSQKENLRHVGSAAVHVYQSEILEQYFYVSQVCMSEVPEPMASQALTDLRGALMESYGRKRQVLRSGL